MAPATGQSRECGLIRQLFDQIYQTRGLQDKLLVSNTGGLQNLQEMVNLTLMMTPSHEDIF